MSVKTPAGSADGKQPEKRRPGRPKKVERPVTPEVLEEIGQLWLKGKSNRKIGELLGVAHSTVTHHVEHTIKPLWRNRVQFEASIEIARADEVIRLAFEGYDRSLRPATKNRQKYSAEQIKAKIRKKAPAGLNRERLLERTLETIERDGDRGWLELVLAAMDFKAKVKGGYAPAQVRISQASELRVAGVNPIELDELMFQRIAELTAERQRHANLLDQARRAAGHN